MEIECDGARFVFTRGFVSELRCTWQFFRTHADAIRRATPLTDVWLTTWPVGVTIVGQGNGIWTITGYPGITFHLPNVESVVSGFPSWGHEPGGWTAAQPLRSGGR
jgi:hypothetical protein